MKASCASQTHVGTTRVNPVFTGDSAAALRCEPSWRKLVTAVRGRSQFAVNVLTNAGGNSLNSVLQLALLLALGRLLAKDVYAAWLTAGAIIGIGEMASDFGTRLWAVRRFAGPEHAALTLKYCLVNKLLFTLASIAVLSLLPLNTLTASALLLSILVAATSPGSDPLLWYLRGRERLDVEAGLVLTCRLVIAIALATAAAFQMSLTVLLSAWLACNVIRIVWESRLPFSRPVFVGFRHVRLTRKGVQQSVIDVLPLGVSLTLAPFFAHSVLLFVTVYGSDSDVTQFGTAYKLVHSAGFIGTSIVVSSFARLARAVQTENGEAAQQIIRTKLLLVTAALAPICILGTLTAVPLAHVLLKPELKDVGVLIVLLMPGLYLTCVNMAVRFTMNAFAFNRQDVLAMIVGCAVFVIAFQMSEMLWLPIRVTVSWTLNEVAMLVVRWIFLKRHSRHHGVATGLVLSTLSGLTALAGTMFLYW
ncbi:MAG: hypothetical protein R3C59_03030 [Planctomycetaceae bacterium]